MVLAPDAVNEITYKSQIHILFIDFFLVADMPQAKNIPLSYESKNKEWENTININISLMHLLPFDYYILSTY